LKTINLEETRKNAETYFLVNIGDQEVSLFVDVGASCCIVTQEFLKSLGTIYRKIEKPLSLLPADGGNMEILGYATIVLTIGQKVNLFVEFAVVAMLEHGIISHCQSPWRFQPVLAPKADGTLRFCINFKPLNRINLKDKYPVPLILELLHFITGNERFSVMDCFADYWQI
jgi:hypothetical protein